MSNKYLIDFSENQLSYKLSSVSSHVSRCFLFSPTKDSKLTTNLMVPTAILSDMFSIKCPEHIKRLFNLIHSAVEPLDLYQYPLLIQQSLTTPCLTCCALMMTLAMRMCWTWSTLKQRLKTLRGMLRCLSFCHTFFYSISIFLLNFSSCTDDIQCALNTLNCFHS